MAYGQALSHTPQVFRTVPFIELRQSLPSRISIISPFVDQLMRFIARFRNADGSEREIEMAMREALANAIIHGNKKDARKRVYVVCRCTSGGEVSIRIEDEGQGFDVDNVPDPTTRENRLLTHGRGIYLMKTLTDEVCFEQGGAAVCMRKAPNKRPQSRRT
ncbi:MAG: ATP-binding protein [Candidatus Sulfotelmatobacter sp.]